MKEIVLFLIPGILEVVGLLAFSLSLGRADLRWGRITAAAVCVAVIVYFVRSIPMAQGLHIIVGIILPFFLIVMATRIPPSRAFVAVFTGMLALGIIEFSLHTLFLKLSGMAPEQMYSNQLVWSALGVVQATVIICLALVIAKMKTPEEGSWKI